ncbi:MAG TPA: sigma-54 dependent transcriptional regulator [Gemmatimonadaceae bacterium]|nr:sigma-54 dependent transcriptional regulator [Gemmatimonadaceae bacterium]
MRDEEGIRVLIAEDDASLAALLERSLTRCGHRVAVRTDGRAALDALKAEAFDVALLSLVMPTMDGLDVLQRVREETEPPEMIIMTGNGTVDTAIRALELGACDYVTKPCQMAEIELRVHRAWEKRRLAREAALLRAQPAYTDGAPAFVTSYAPMRAVLALAERAAESDSAVLIAGEPGTGKELLARLMHHRSPRAKAPLAELDCAAHPRHAIESTLFGHEPGAGATARERRLGLLELAQGGTLVLDGVGEFERRVQGTLLRAMEHGAFHRVGGTQTVYSDVRVIALTRENLAQRVADGSFGGELFHYLATISITLPPLRERRVDVRPLAEHFLGAYGGKRSPALGEDAVAALEAYAWPGNVRELRRVMERARWTARGRVIHQGDLLLPTFAPNAAPPASAQAYAREPLLSLKEMERRHIELVLRRLNWHQGRSASALGISPKTLYRKIRAYGIARPAGAPAGR